MAKSTAIATQEAPQTTGNFLAAIGGVCDLAPALPPATGGAGNFLRRIELYSSGDRVVSGQIQAGHWGCPEAESTRDFGTNLDVMVLARRVKALDTSDRNKPLSSFNPESELFKAIDTRFRAGVRDFKTGSSYLVLTRSGDFYELFCRNKSMDQVDSLLAEALPSRKGGVITLGSKPAKNSKGTWMAPTVTSCSVAFDNLNVEEIKAAITRFFDEVHRETAAPASTENTTATTVDTSRRRD